MWGTLEFIRGQCDGGARGIYKAQEGLTKLLFVMVFPWSFEDDHLPSSVKLALLAHLCVSVHSTFVPT